MKINWRQKLSSRKFWALLGAFAMSMMVAFHVDGATAERVVGCITAFGAVAVYVLAEAKVDAARAEHEEADDVAEAKELTPEHVLEEMSMPDIYKLASLVEDVVNKGKGADHGTAD